MHGSNGGYDTNGRSHNISGGNGQMTGGYDSNSNSVVSNRDEVNTYTGSSNGHGMTLSNGAQMQHHNASNVSPRGYGGTSNSLDYAS